MDIRSKIKNFEIFYHWISSFALLTIGPHMVKIYSAHPYTGVCFVQKQSNVALN